MGILRNDFNETDRSTVLVYELESKEQLELKFGWKEKKPKEWSFHVECKNLSSPDINSINISVYSAESLMSLSKDLNASINLMDGIILSGTIAGIKTDHLPQYYVSFDEKSGNSYVTPSAVAKERRNYDDEAALFYKTSVNSSETKQEPIPDPKAHSYDDETAHSYRTSVEVSETKEDPLSEPVSHTYYDDETGHSY